MQTFRSVKGVCEEKDSRDGSSLADLRPMHRVAPCHCLVGITLPKNKGHTLFEVMGVMAHLPRYLAKPSTSTLLTCGLGSHSQRVRC
jgi:hypothetical protein